MRHCIDRYGWIRLKRDEKGYQKMQSDRASELERIRETNGQVPVLTRRFPPLH